MRRYELIKILKENMHNPHLTVEKLSDLMKVSHRTIRYDLEQVEDELLRGGYLLIRKPGKGVWVENIKLVSEYNDFREKPAYHNNYSLSPEERRNAIIINLLDSQVPLSTNQLAEKLMVSRSTLRSDLKNISNFLQGKNLTLQSKRGVGLWIEGHERLIRGTLAEIFVKCAYNSNFLGLGETKCTFNESTLFQQYARRLPVDEITAYLIEMVKKWGLVYTDFSINYMVVSLVVQLSRVKIGKFIKQTVRSVTEEIRKEALYCMAVTIADDFAKQYEVHFDESEVTFLTLQLLGTLQWPLPGGKGKDAAVVLSLNLAGSFITSCQTWLGDIFSDDEELLYGLAIHLQPVIQRAKYGISLSNPMLPKIKERYRDLFLIVKQSVQKIESELGTLLSDDEIGYLTIYLGAAIERRKVRFLKKPKVLLVCGNGIGTAQLLLITLQNRIPYLDIIRVASAYETRQEDVTEIDLVISTVPLKIEGVAVLTVPPILVEAEMQVIEDQILYLCNKKVPLTGKSGIGGGLPMLGNVLVKETISLSKEAGNWEQAIRAAGELLVQTGAVEPRYVDSMVELVRKMGPYIVIAPGVAMPHARPEDGVIKVCLSMVRLDTPVPFGNQANDPVDLVFALGGVDNESHLLLLSQLGRMLGSEETLQVMRSSDDIETILELISRYSKG